MFQQFKTPFSFSESQQQKMRNECLNPVRLLLLLFQRRNTKSWFHFWITLLDCFNKHRFQCRAASVWRILKLLCGKRKGRGKQIWSVIRSPQSARSHTHAHTPIGIWQGYYSGAVGDGRKIKFWWGHCIISLWVRSVFSVWLLRDDSPLNAWVLEVSSDKFTSPVISTIMCLVLSANSPRMRKVRP